MVRGVASVTQLETVTQALAVAEAVLAATDAQNAMAEGVLDRSQAALVGPDTGAAAAGACCIDLTAPADGVVLDIAMISAHPVTAGTPLVSIGDPGDLEIVADLLSSDAVRIAPGTRARVERWGGEPPLQAVLRRVEPVAETIVSALGIEEQRVDAIFDITSPPGDRAALGHGFSVFLRIVEWDSPAALQVPLGALVRRGEGWAVFVAENGIATERPVTLGRRGARTVEITSGLEEGAVIVTHPSDAITDGARVMDRRSL